MLAPLDAFRGSSEWASPEPVLMLVEVTASDPDDNRRDRIDKPRAYAQSRIPIYLLVDREAAEVIVYSKSNGERYRQVTH